MQSLVSYSPRTLPFAFILYLSSQELAVAQLASLVAYIFISPENFSVPPFLSSIYRILYHALYDMAALARICYYPHCLMPSGVDLDQLVLFLESKL
jgi:hypothetical protein